MSTANHLDDEQLTALQDGDGTVEERAHLGTCSRCADRSEALTAVAALVAAPPPPPADRARDEAVTAALAGADRPVAPLRRPRRQVPSWLLPAAAVVALLALVAVVVPRWGDGDDDETAAGRLDATAESGGGDGDAGGAGGGAASEAPALRRAAEPDLGAVDDEAELARRVEDALAGTAAADAAAEPSAADPCVAGLRAADLTLEPLRFRASLVWQGRPALVLSDGTRAVVVATAGCARLADVDLG
ncbi:MAG: hypothetical protein K0R11_679 [Acidimicrobiales bacterium]|nr:hypothetical protein [Acidimicrobiales bacterium]